MNLENPGQNTLQNENIRNYRSLRQFVGFLGILLPSVLLLGNLISHQIERSTCAILPESVSGYYYTPLRGVFVGILCAIGVFLVAYIGPKWDRWITDLAGGLAIVVALCPTKPTQLTQAQLKALKAKHLPISCGSVAHLSSVQNIVGDIHLGAACCLFILLAWMSLRFANKLPPWTNWWPERLDSKSDLLFKLCGSMIIICVIGAAVANFTISSSLPVLFTFEGIAVISFAISWLVKGLITEANPDNRLYNLIKRYVPTWTPRTQQRMRSQK